ncbi:FUSC family protein [Streptomyces sp. NRRL F-5053]|uniref:FUSC family protein n=1 Tax=Streptomyces sp. NRRL F-5053 TaxID=1463854 RepID=UPI0004C59303|nr:aromatic acid exporter family protein [Streptomyces sp. NRRL F-5053]
MGESEPERSHTGTAQRRIRTAPARLRDHARRVTRRPGPDRDLALLTLKSGTAGVLAWSLAAYVIESPQPTYAPFTALLVVQSTAYRSLLHSGRYVLAVVLGVLAAGAAGPALGENPAAFAAMLAVTLVIGRWQRLGSQGLQVSVAGTFAYNALSGTHLSMLAQIIEMAALGAATGLTVSLLVLPPLRYRTAEQGSAQLAHAVQLLLRDVGQGLRDGLPDQETVQDWMRRARRLDRTLSSAREAVETGAESTRYNPRLWLRPHSASTNFRGYRTLVESLARASEQLRSICYGLARLRELDPSVTPDEDFLRCYGQLLGTLSRAASEIGTLAGDGADEAPLHRSLREARAQRGALAEQAAGEAWVSHGVLLTDVERLLTEFHHAHEHGAPHPT